MRFPRLLSPILIWEMTTLVRRQRYYWLRALYALLLLFLLWTVYSETFSRRMFRYQQTDKADVLKISVEFAAAFFTTFSIAQLTAILVLTPAYVATAITVERERRTIEYLFTTDLSNAEIVLGKWAARSLNVVMVILVGFPILGLTRFFGGISFDGLLLLSAVSMATLVSTSSLAILASVHGRQTRRVIMDAYGYIFFLLISPMIPFVAAESLRATAVLRGWTHPLIDQTIFTLISVRDFLTLVNPYSFLSGVVLRTSNLGTAADDVWILVGAHTALAVVCLSVSVLRVRSVYRRTVSQGDSVKRSWFTKKAKIRKTYEVRGEPVAWREWRFGGGGRYGRIRKALGLLAYSACVTPFAIDAYELLFQSRSVSQLSIPPEVLNAYLRGVGTMVIVLALAATAGRGATTISSERDKDTWISLLSSPLSAVEIIGGKVLGSLKPIFHLVIALSPFWLLAVAFGAMSLFAVPLLLLWIALFGWFAANLGVYQSLIRVSTGRAIGFTFAILALLGGVGHLFGMMLMFPLQWFFNNNDIWLFFAMSIPWVTLGGSSFTNSEFSSALRGGKDLTWMLFSGIGVAIGYFLAAGWLFARSCAKFQSVTGRIENELTPVVDRRPVLPGLIKSSQ